MAAAELIPRTPVEIINLPTTVDREGWPGGYTVLHLVAGGADRHRRRYRLVELLIEAKGDVDVKLQREGQLSSDVGFLTRCERRR